MDEELTIDGLQCKCTDLQKTMSTAATQVHFIFYAIICLIALPISYFKWMW